MILEESELERPGFSDVGEESCEGTGVNDAEDAGDVRFHRLDDRCAVMFPFLDAVVVVFKLCVKCGRDAGDVF